MSQNRHDDLPLERWGILAGLLYGFLLIPTLLLAVHCWGNDISVSSLISRTWNASFWSIPGLPAKASSVITDVLVFLLIGVQVWVYIQGYRAISAPGKTSVRSGKSRLAEVLRWTLLSGLILVFVIPFHSRDIYGYINRGAEQAYYAANPYLTPVAGIPGWTADPMFHKHWINNPSPYGFFFTLLTRLVVLLSGHHFTLAFLGFKLLNLLTHLGLTWLVFRVAVLLRLRRPWLSAYLYGWNPLILLHALGNGHNDILLSALLLAALAALFSIRRKWASLPLLALSILVKYASLLAAPFMGIYLIRIKAWRSLLLGSGLAMLLVLLLAWPFVQGVSQWPPETAGAMVENAGLSQHSLNSMLSRLVYYIVGLFVKNDDSLLDSTREALRIVFWVGFIAFYIGLFFRYVYTLFSQPVSEALAVPARRLLGRRILQAMLVMVVFVSAKFHAWYLGMFFPLALLLVEFSRLRQFVLLLSLFQLLAFTPLENIHILNYLLLVLAPLGLVLWIGRRKKESDPG